MNSKHRKLLGSLLSLTLGASSLGSSTVVLANESDGTDFDAMISDNQLSIGNNKISRTFSVTDGKVATTGVVNHKIDRTLTPGLDRRTLSFPHRRMGIRLRKTLSPILRSSMLKTLLQWTVLAGQHP